MIPETVKTHTKLLLTRRGYDSITYLEDSDSGKKPRFVAKNKDERVDVFFVEPNKVTINVINAIISLVTKTSNTATNIIIVYKHALTPDAKQSIRAGASIFQFEVFSFDEMSYDPIEAVSVVRKVPKETAPKEWSKLPSMLTSDPIVRYFGWKHGDTVAIEENNGCISYRKCVKTE